MCDPPKGVTTHWLRTADFEVWRVDRALLARRAAGPDIHCQACWSGWSGLTVDPSIWTRRTECHLGRASLRKQRVRQSRLQPLSLHSVDLRTGLQPFLLPRLDCHTPSHIFVQATNVGSNSGKIAKPSCPRGEPSSLHPQKD